MMLLDERGNNCPIPVIHTKEALAKAALGDKLRVIVDNEVAVQNVRKLIGHYGLSCSLEKKSDAEFWIESEITSLPKDQTAAAEHGAEEETEAAADETVSCTPDQRKKGLVVAFASNRMGEPHEELGALLMNGFVFALLKQDQLPETMIFYNGGAELTCEGSPVLADLKEMAALGVDIVTCGTCVKTLGIEEKVSVGRISNMYEIVELLTKAKSVVRP